MGRVTLHFSEDDYQIFRHYCANYCPIHDETRKNSIKILLELYKHQVIDIQEHTLHNIFTFFYQKKQEFETGCKILAGDADELIEGTVHIAPYHSCAESDDDIVPVQGYRNFWGSRSGGGQNPCKRFAWY